MAGTVDFGTQLRAINKRSLKVYFGPNEARKAPVNLINYATMMQMNERPTSLGAS